ncbi:MAG: hypothetical protein LIO46_05385 [Clostridiales bacterium]|nr:hypothetical protein [Clostridiales bacterium]
MQISYQGYAENILTFRDGGAVPGQPAAISGEAAVTAPAGGDFIGVCRNTRQGLAGVQLSGYVELPYSGTAPDYGLNALGADGEGGVQKADADAADVQSRYVIHIDTDSQTVGLLL